VTPRIGDAVVSISCARILTSVEYIR
jgi:hypothetical protein